MTYAARIIEALGGTRAVAKYLGIPPTTVQTWKTSGVIPARRQQSVLDMARAIGKPLSPADFFDTGEAAA